MKEGGKGGYEIELVPVEGGVSGPATPENFKFECGMAYLDCIYGGMEGWRPPQLGWISRLHPGGGGGEGWIPPQLGSFSRPVRGRGS